MRIDCWLVVAGCTLDDLPIAAFDSEDEAHDYCASLEALSLHEQRRVFYDAFVASGLPRISELIRFSVCHVPIQLSRNVAGECPARSSGDRGQAVRARQKD